MGALPTSAQIQDFAARNPKKFQYALEKSICEESLIGFIKVFWDVLEPSVDLKTGWALDAMAEHLEALSFDNLDNLLINVPPGMMKPVSASELIHTERGLIPLGEIVVGDMVLTHRGRYRKVTAVHEQGVLPVVQVNTFNGAGVVAAPDHPFLTTQGWIEAGKLTSGQYVGRPHGPDIAGDDMHPMEARLLGYIVGDGCVSQPHASFVNNDRDTLDDFHACAAYCGFHTVERAHNNPNCTARRISLNNFAVGAKKNTPGGGPVTQWLKKHGLWRKNSYTKVVPEAVFRGGSQAMRNFLGAYWSCDGGVYIRHSGKKTTMKASLTTVSHELAKGVWAICGALNIDTRIRIKKRKLKTKAQPNGEYVSYEVLTSRRNEVAKIALLPGLTERKRIEAEKAVRDTFDPNIYADEVLSVNNAGEAECRCLTVDQDSSFVAGGLIVHNSLMCGTFWPAWEWGPLGKTHLQYIHISYAGDLAKRNHMKTRALIASDRFHGIWGNIIHPSPKKKDTESEYHLAGNGNSFATGTGGKLTGYRGDRLITDDPHSVDGAESDLDRARAVRWFTETLSTRYNDENTVKRLVIMQRIHEGDISGHILESMPGRYEHLCLPMRFESDRRCRTSIGWSDPRENDGDLLFPERFSDKKQTEVEDDMMSMGGEYAVAGQMQQRPAPRGGGAFKIDNIDIVDRAPPGGQSVRGWDFAGSIKKDSPFTAGVQMKMVDKILYIEDVRRFRLKIYDAEKLVIDVVKSDGIRVKQDMPQDPGSAGKSQVSKLSGEMAGYDFVFSPETGAKEDRAIPFASYVNVGKVRLVRAGWNKAYISELSKFPRGKFMDQVDASSRAFSRILKQPAGYSGRFTPQKVARTD